MAIVNVSPDSFSGDGLSTLDQVRGRIQDAAQQGADILDIGGQSTRPGAIDVGEQEELRRVLPAIEAARELTGLPVSVDTFNPAVARQAIKAGASIVNSVFADNEAEMVQLVIATKTKLVIMHSRGNPQTMSSLVDYPEGVVRSVISSLRERADKAVKAGLPADQIILDPGIGFAKTAAQSFELTAHLKLIKTLGFPILYGASLKSFIGRTLSNDSEQQVSIERRAHATTSVQTYAMLQGVDIVRVHDVQAAADARRIVQKIREAS